VSLTVDVLDREPSAWDDSDFSVGFIAVLAHPPANTLDHPKKAEPKLEPKPLLKVEPMVSGRKNFNEISGRGGRI
jgi:hypothetical protein